MKKLVKKVIRGAHNPNWYHWNLGPFDNKSQPRLGAPQSSNVRTPTLRRHQERTARFEHAENFVEDDPVIFATVDLNPMI